MAEHHSGNLELAGVGNPDPEPQDEAERFQPMANLEVQLIGPDGVVAFNLGRTAYEAYCQTTGGVSLASGGDLPSWDDQAEGYRVAWTQAAIAVVLKALS